MQRGEWEALLNPWPGDGELAIMGTHLVHLKTDQILVWKGQFAVDPATGIRRTKCAVWTRDESIAPFLVWNETTDMFCAGHAQLDDPDGRIMTGGSDFMTAWRFPYAQSDIFEIGDGTAQTAKWVQAAIMKYPRWYPTLTALPDSRILACSGIREENRNEGVPSLIATIPEFYNPMVKLLEVWVPLESADRPPPDQPGLYPYMFVLPALVKEEWMLFDAGPRRSQTRLLDPRTWTWSAPFTSVDIPSTTLAQQPTAAAS